MSRSEPRWVRTGVHRACILAGLLFHATTAHGQGGEEQLQAALELYERLPTPSQADSGPPGPVREAVVCEVSRIIDGDTIECVGVGRVRLIGIDTPEMSQAPHGAIAMHALAALAPVGSRVEIEPDVERRDRYDRTLGYVWAEGMLVNWLLVRGGWAVVTTYPPNVQYVDWLVEAQLAAREERVGLWAIDGFECLPAERRRGQCD